MPTYRRFKLAGATYFFTVVTESRRPFLIDPLARQCLWEAFAVVRNRYPFEIPAIVLLPDHLHTIWAMPRNDADYSLRWRRIKEEFTRRYLAGGGEEGEHRSASRQIRTERAVWQRRFWEHLIRDEDDLERHIDYLHYNPVKHGLAKCAHDWEFSSFRRWARQGAYPEEWGCPDRGEISFDDLDLPRWSARYGASPGNRPGSAAWHGGAPSRTRRHPTSRDVTWVRTTRVAPPMCAGCPDPAPPDANSYNPRIVRGAYADAPLLRSVRRHLAIHG